jgi:hypothetical protein
MKLASQKGTGISFLEILFAMRDPALKSLWKLGYAEQLLVLLE